MSTRSGSEFGSVCMRTTRKGHLCNFTWTLRNITQIGQSERKFRIEFKLHPTCNEMWEMYAFYPFPNELAIGYQAQLRSCPQIGPGSTLGIYNTRGDCYDVKKFDWSHPLREDLTLLLKKPENEVQPIIAKNGKVFEIINDTLVIKGTASVSFCCSRTVLYED